jgi:hypothetical protein
MMSAASAPPNNGGIDVEQVDDDATTTKCGPARPAVWVRLDARAVHWVDSFEAALGRIAGEQADDTTPGRGRTGGERSAWAG